MTLYAVVCEIGMSNCYVDSVWVIREYAESECARLLNPAARRRVIGKAVVVEFETDSSGGLSAAIELEMDETSP